MRQGPYIVVINLDDVDAASVCSGEDVGIMLSQAKDDVFAELGVGRVVCADFGSVLFKYFDAVVIECEPYSAFVIYERGRNFVFLTIWRFKNFAAVDVNENLAGMRCT